MSTQRRSNCARRFTRAGFCPGPRPPRGRCSRPPRQGGYPAFLADLRDDRGAAVPFFGAPARSTVFPALLARTTGLPLYAGAAFRRPDVHFVIRGARIPVPETNDREADAIVATAALQKQFETFIREAPEQWMWAHRKWDEGRGGRYSEIFGIIPADQ